MENRRKYSLTSGVDFLYKFMGFCLVGIRGKEFKFSKLHTDCSIGPWGSEMSCELVINNKNFDVFLKSMYNGYYKFWSFSIDIQSPYFHIDEYLSSSMGCYPDLNISRVLKYSLDLVGYKHHPNGLWRFFRNP